MAILPQLGENDKNIVYAVRLTYDATYEYRYVGQTSTGTTRMKVHIYNASNSLNPEYLSGKYRWMRKHCFSITFDVLEICESAESLNFAEMKWIHILKTKGHRLLNLTDGGDGIRGHKHTEKTRILLSHKATGRTASEATKAKMSSSRTGKSPTPETRKKLSIANSGINNAMYGRTLAPEHKEKISPKGRKHSEETKAKMSESMRGNQNALGWVMPEKAKAKLSSARRGSNNPNFGRTPSEATRQKMSDSRVKNNHIRWHVNRGTTNPSCKHCL